MSQQVFKVLLLSLIGIMALCHLLVAKTHHPIPPIESINRIVAIVNKDIITRTMLDQAIANMRAQMQTRQISLPNKSILRHEVLNELINQKLMLQMAEQMKINITPNELNRAIHKMAQRNHLSLEQLKQKIINQGGGYPHFRSEIQKQMRIAKVQQQAIGDKVHVSEQDIKVFISRYSKTKNAKFYHIADMLISSEPNDDQKAKEHADTIFKQLKQGASFSELAKRESQGENAQKGGDLGWLSQDQLPALFIQKLASMKVLQMSSPFKADNGYHILKLLGIKQNHQAISQKQAYAILWQRKWHKQVAKWVSLLRKSAYIHML